MASGLVVGVVVGVAVGIALGAAGATAVVRGRAAARQAAAQQEHHEALARLRVDLAEARSALEHGRALAVDRAAAAEDVRALVAAEFATLSRQALAQNNEQFLQLAHTRLETARHAAEGDLEQRRQAIEHLLAPLQNQLGRYEEGLRRLERERQETYGALRAQVVQLGESQERLRAETRNLVTALRAPATRGRWGEMQLRRVVEMAGMVPHCDFDEQVTTAGDEGTLRPDMVVHLPGARKVVVDAKVPLEAFLAANDATDDTERRTHEVAHARHLRSHVDALAKKTYWQQFERSPEFVVAFVPGDSLLAVALEHDVSLLEHAVANQVLLATPTTLIALLRTVAYGWQHEDLADNARLVEQIGRELYKRLATFGEHLARTGRSLNGAVEAYNKAVGSLERTVLPQARRFNDLGVVGSADKALPELEQLDSVARELQAPELVSSAGAPGAPALEVLPGEGSPASARPSVAQG